MDSGVLEFAQVMAVIVMSIGGLVAIALGTRILWRQGSRAGPGVVATRDGDRLERLETAVDTIAIEVERISEAQRFMVGLLSDALPARRAERAELPAGTMSGGAITPR